MLLFFIGWAFWRTPPRKLYAVSKRIRKRAISDPSDDSDEDFIPKRSKRICSASGDGMRTILKNIQDTLKEIMAVNKDSRLPIGLKKVLNDTFKCSICQETPIKPPAIITKCCKTILGCSDCVNQWFRGDDALTKTCPKCRAEHGFNQIMVLRGLDSFLDVISGIEGGGSAELD